MVELDKRTAEDAREILDNYKNIETAKKYTNCLIEDILKSSERGNNTINAVFHVMDFNDLDRNILTGYTARKVHKYLVEKGFDTYMELHNRPPQFYVDNIMCFDENKASSIRVEW